MKKSMESTRRQFDDRSREPALKKPRLTDEPVALDRSSNGRPRSFLHRPAPPSQTASRLRAGGDSESSETARGTYPPTTTPPPQQQIFELVNQYKTALSDLTFNSKPIITNLTIIAGKNLHAAKAIAATICANILEVPREQKLPSLYLLDSIVKNIGRDYIKYFASRLPEVFCKAYRQVDPSIHPGMRHLFGTWKGVFPSPTLQVIEKELGFVPVVNSSSSGTASRSDAPAAHHAHSIHVNPKYLEARQRFEDSTRATGTAINISGNLVNSSEERLDRTPSVSSGKPWTGPPLKNVQQPQREQLSTALDGSENDSIISKQSGLVIGRAGEKYKEQLLDKPWFECASDTPTVSDQENGFDIKPKLQSYPALKSSNCNANTLPRSSFLSRGISSTTKSWKNSEEEEYMWDDFNSRQTDRGAMSSSGFDCWASDDSGRTSEASADSLSIEQKGQASTGHQITSSWAQEPTLLDDMGHLLSSRKLSSNSGSYLTSLNGLPTSASAVGRPLFQSKMGPSSIGTSDHGFSSSTLGSMGSVRQQRQTIGAASPSAQSPMHHHPSSPSFSVHGAGQVAHNLTEHEQEPALPHADLRVPQFSKHLNIGSRSQFNQDSLPLPSQNVHLGFGRSSTANNLFSDDPNPVVTESCGQPSTSSLLAAVMNSGVLGGNLVSGSSPCLNSQDAGVASSQASKQPLPIHPPPTHSTALGHRISPASISNQPSHEIRTNSSIFPHRNVDRPSLDPGKNISTLVDPLAPQMSATNSDSAPVSSLLSSLVEKGLISASKMESVTSATPDASNQPQNQSLKIASTSSTQVSPAPPSLPLSSSSTKKELPGLVSASKSEDLLPQSDTSEARNRIGFQFKSDVLRKYYPAVISELLEDLPYKCSICCIRVKIQEQLDKHLEWHALRSKDENRLNKEAREWYLNSGVWISGNAGILSINKSLDILEDPSKRLADNEHMVHADESQCLCILCGELFEDFYSEERDQWMFKGAVYASLPCIDGKTGISDGASQGSMVHAKCLSESSVLDLGCAKDIKLEKVN